MQGLLVGVNMIISIWFENDERKKLKNISGIYSGKSKKLANSHVTLFASEKDNIIKTYYSDQIKKVTIKYDEKKK